MSQRIGRPQPKLEASDAVNGRLEFIDDLVPRAGVLYGHIIRSPYPHARITAIDTAKAEQLRGVRSIITPFNTSQVKFGLTIEDETVLTAEPRYIGDEVAAIAAEDEETALAAANCIAIQYQQLPAHFNLPEPTEASFEPLQVAASVRVNTGDSAEAFEASPVSVQLDLETSMQLQVSMEPFACLAGWSSLEGLLIRCPLQDPANTREYLAKVLGLPEAKIRIIQPPIGGSYGSKLFHRKLTYICALLAMRTRRQVYLKHSMEEEFIAGRPRVPAKIHIELGADLDGQLKVQKTRVTADNGAYSSYAPGPVNVMVSRVNALYRTPVIDNKVDLLYTNKIPTGSMRGFGNITMLFALESAMDTLARKLKIHPIELRKRNIFKEGESSALGWKIGSSQLLGCLEVIARESDRWLKQRRAQPAEGIKTGLGFTCAVHVSSNRTRPFDGASAAAKLNDDGSVFIMSGDGDVGQGIRTTQAIIASEVLGIDISRITVAPVDTTWSPFGLGVFADRGTTITGMAVLMAVEELKQEILKTAGEMLSTSETKLVDGCVVSGEGKRLPLGEIAKYSLWRRNGKALSGYATYDPDTIPLDPREGFVGNPSTGYTFCAQAAEVEIDTRTGRIKVLKIASAHDSGRIINPLMAQGQVHGAIMQGLGYALMENLVVTDGEVKNPGLRNYKIPTAMDLPEISVHFVESSEKTGPFGAKGIGQTGMLTIAPAIANAVYDATGVRLTKVPFTPENVWRTLSAAPTGN